MEADTTLLALGRMLIGALFVVAGVRHFFIADVLTPMIAARGIPAPRLVLYAGSIFEAVLGALLALGLFVAPAAFGLCVFVAAATLLLVNFWDRPPGPEREALQNAALSNMAIIGGLLVVAASAL